MWAPAHGRRRSHAAKHCERPAAVLAQGLNSIDDVSRRGVPIMHRRPSILLLALMIGGCANKQLSQTK
ncbi:MAG TPA: hypothetical protein VG755_36070, partial [Nannocystaceae bacterium]|nr:hypothetical protein [Nannocystaceae bacterium]